MKHKIAARLSLVALSLGVLTASQANASTVQVKASGGPVTFVARIKNVGTCKWTASPQIPRFSVFEKCNEGRVSRTAHLPINKTGKVKSILVELTVHGKTLQTFRWTVRQAGKKRPTTTTTRPVTTTTNAPTTTTTETQIINQQTTIYYDGFLSYNEQLSGLFYANEDADLTITGLSLSPGGGTVSFYDANGSFICSGGVDSNPFATVVSCQSGFGYAVAPPTPIRAVYSGTLSGYDDGHGTWYAGSTAQGAPDA